MLTWWNAVEAAGTRDALSSMRLVGEVAAGSGVERRLVGIAELPAPPAILVSLAFGGVAGLLVLGAWRSVELARGGRRELAAPLVWTVVPAVMLIVGGGPLRPDLLQSLLPGFAVVVALATAPIGRWSARLRPVALIVAGTFAGFGGATIAVLLWSAMGHSQTHAAVPYAAWASAGTSRDEAVREWRDSPAASLRFWQSVASEARDAASRTGRPEIAVVGGGASDAGASILSSLLGDEIAVRPLPPETVVLPLEREAIYLLMPGQQAPPELAWPSARLGSVPLTPTDAAARVVALRPRPVAHWLALHPGGTEVRFADGTVLLAARSRTVPGGQHEVELVWLTGSPASDQPEPRATEVSVTERVTGDDSRVARVPLPEPLASGGTELVVQRITLGASPPAGPASVSVRPTSESGRTVQPIDRASGTDGGVDIMRSR
jgi:hypothetical protein